MKGPYHYQNPKMLFHGARFDVIDIEDQKDGKVYTRQIVDHPGAVIILPLTHDDKIIMIRNKREGVLQTLWELPAGTLEKGEEPLFTAKRELEEETGYTSQDVRFLFQFFSTPGFCNEILYAYIAKDLTFAGQHLDPTESIEVYTLSLDEALDKIQRGIICDAKTICLLLYYSQFVVKK